MCLPGELRYRSFSNRFLVNMFDNDAHPKSQVSNSRIVFSVSKSRMMQDETRKCEMMQDGVAELFSFLLPSFVKLVFC